jgi:hypothetical protein
MVLGHKYDEKKKDNFMNIFISKTKSYKEFKPNGTNKTNVYFDTYLC